jgi:hypothetical protein
MKHRIRLAGAVERRRGKAFQSMVAKLQSRMLAGDIEAGRLAEVGKRAGNRTELDRFRTRSDDERNS